MDGTLYSILKGLLLPPGGLILLFILAFALVRGVLGRLLMFIGVAILTLMSLPPVAAALMAGLETIPALAPRTLASTGADGILILGSGRYPWAPEYGGDTVGTSSLERVRYGAFLHRQTGLPVYITGGNREPRDPKVGQLMARVLQDEFGIKAAGVEYSSLTTEQNAFFSESMLDKDGIRHVLLVTHAWHMPRAMAAFDRAGIRATAAPTAFVHRGDKRDLHYGDWLPSAGAFLTSYRAIHEHLGQVWYQLKATLRLGPYIPA